MSWRVLFMQEMPVALALALPSAGKSRLAKIAITAMTTRSSMSVNAPRKFGRRWTLSDGVVVEGFIGLFALEIVGRNGSLLETGYSRYQRHIGTDWDSVKPKVGAGVCTTTPISTNDGRLRPDLIVRSTGGKNIVVDFGSWAEQMAWSFRAVEIRRITTSGHVISPTQDRRKISKKNVCIEGHPSLKAILANENQDWLIGLKRL
jgi:hypothetical protein